jgi:response regulator RpfG family c-di-GMP phosphodiesterase
MSGWVVWTVFGVAGWLVLSVPTALGLARAIGQSSQEPSVRQASAADRPAASRQGQVAQDRPRVLVVDDDPSLRMLLETTIAQSDLDVHQAADAEYAEALIERWQPAVVVLDVGLPGRDGLSLCQDLKRRNPEQAPAVVLLTGERLSQSAARLAGADALLQKPFSPLELMAVIERLAGHTNRDDARQPVLREAREEEQLDLYARDLGRLLSLERARRSELEEAYRQTIESLATALEWKDAATGGHAFRVQRYAVELAALVDPALLGDGSVEAGFLLHDVGKIAIPDSILLKRGPLTPAEQELMRRHTIIGSDLLATIPLLAGEGLGIVRSHHERWDGAGYPDALAGEQIPPGARIFAVADALDAMTSDRPYRQALSWSAAAEEIAAQSGRHFDPDVAEAFELLSPRLEGMRRDFSRAVA